MENSIRKRKSANENTSYTDCLQQHTQDVKVKSIQKASNSKNTRRLHLDTVFKLQPLSKRKQKQEEVSPLVENINIISKPRRNMLSHSGSKVKDCEVKISIAELPRNLSLIKNCGKENLMPSKMYMQTRSNTKNESSTKQHLLHSKSNNKQTIPCYEKNVSVVGNPSRKLIFQGSPVAGAEENIYDFDEDDVSSKPRHKRGKSKLKKKLNSSDEEYVPSNSRFIGGKPKPAISKTFETNHGNVRCKRKIPNSVCQSETKNSPQAGLLSVNMKQCVSYNGHGCNSSENSLQVSRCRQTEQAKNEVISISSDLSVSCENFFLKPVKIKKPPSFSTYENDSVPSGEITPCKHKTMLNINNTVTYIHSPSQMSTPTAYIDPKAYVERVCSIEDDLFLPFSSEKEDEIDVHKVENPPVDFKGFTSTECMLSSENKLCSKNACLCNIKMPSKGQIKPKDLTEFHCENGLRVTNAKVDPTVYVSNCNDGDTHLKPASCNSEYISSDSGVTLKNVTVLDTDNKENIPNYLSLTSSRRRSKKSWRPTAYVSPKAYRKENCNFEDSFDSPCKTVAKNDVEGLRRIEDISLSEPATTPDNASSSKHSGLVENLNKYPACQKIDNGTMLSHPQVDHTTSVHIKRRDTCAAVLNVDKSTAENSNVGSSNCLSNSNTESSEILSNSATISAVSSNSWTKQPNSLSVSVNYDKDSSRLEIRASRGMTCQSSANTYQIGECNTDNYFGFDHEEHEEELLSPIKLPTCAQLSLLNIATSSTPDHGTSTMQHAVKPWRPPVLDRGVSVRQCNQAQVTSHSFFSKSAPQLKQDASTVLVPEISRSLHHPTSEAEEVTVAVSMPTIFSVNDELPFLPVHNASDNIQPARKVYSHPRRFKNNTLKSLQEENATEDGENVSRKATKKRSKKQTKEEQNVKKFLSEINNEFETIENFELCVE